MASIATQVREAEQIVDGALRAADRGVTLNNQAGRLAARALARILQRADGDLERRLRSELRRSGSVRFTGAQLAAYRRQVQIVLEYTKARMRGLTDAAARAAIRRGWGGTVLSLGRLERAYAGAVRPLRIATAAMMNRELRGLRSSLLIRHATSVDRYGGRVIRQFEDTMARGLIMGSTTTDLVDALVGLGGPRGIVSMAAVEVAPGVVRRLRLEAIPGGLFRRYRYWAMRIVRTEVAHAQNAGAVQALHVARREDFPDMQKKILAVMDNRVADDSIAVHGQIRDLDDPFIDGAGRVYMHPPARPNDREIVIPWRPEWRETPTSRVNPARERRAAETPEGRGEGMAVRFGG